MFIVNTIPKFCSSQFKALWATNSLSGHVVLCFCFKGEWCRATSDACPNQLVTQCSTFYLELIMDSYKYAATLESLGYLRAILYWSIASWYSLTATRKSPSIRCRTQSLWLASAFLSKAIPSSYFCSLPVYLQNYGFN